MFLFHCALHLIYTPVMSAHCPRISNFNFEIFGKIRHKTQLNWPLLIMTASCIMRCTLPTKATK